MDTNKMREQFESWAAKNYVVPPGVGHLFVRSEIGDGYRLSNINHAWHGWQASREAVAIDLSMLAHQHDEGPLYYRVDDVHAAIEAQGLKVAP